MDYLDLMRKLSVKTDSRIVLLVMDGLGGAGTNGGPTELEAAKTPNLDQLAVESVCGLMDPIAPGITPGSGPAHLGLFGYDPVRYEIGRGVLAAAGVAFPLERGDVAARGNFATMDAAGHITDRRAGRIPTEKNAELCKLLDGMKIGDVDVFVRPVKEHRCVAVFRGSGLHPACTDSDPQKTGLAPLPVRAAAPDAEYAADVANRFLDAARERLAGQSPANMILLRGFDAPPHLPSMSEVYKLNPAAIAVYPDYRGIARLLGMDVQETGDTPADEMKTLRAKFSAFDFFFVHVKKTDSYGEDGNFDAKVRVIEETDALIPEILALEPDVLAVTGDHSTPSGLKGHSWHPLPILVRAAHCRHDGVTAFGERACIAGGLGRIPSVSLMPLLMANALKLMKFGA